MKFTKLAGRKLDPKKNIKVYVLAYRKVKSEQGSLGKETKLARSITVYVAGSRSTKYTNVRKIRLAQTRYTLKVKKTAKIKATAVLADKDKKLLPDKYAAQFRYASGNTKVAKVDKNGKVTALKKGTCYIYVYARNGLARKIKVMVNK